MSNCVISNEIASQKNHFFHLSNIQYPITVNPVHKIPYFQYFSLSFFLVLLFIFCLLVSFHLTFIFYSFFIFCLFFFITSSHTLESTSKCTIQKEWRDYDKRRTVGLLLCEFSATSVEKLWKKDAFQRCFCYCFSNMTREYRLDNGWPSDSKPCNFGNSMQKYNFKRGINRIGQS